MPIELPVEVTFPNVASASRAALSKIKAATSGPNISLKELGATGAVVAGAFVAAGAAVKGFLDGVTAVVDESNTLAAAVGTTADVLQGLRQAARASGKELDSVLPDDFTQKMKEAATGSGGAADAFGALGIKLDNADGSLRAFKDVLGDTLDSLKGNQDAVEKSAAAAELFGGKSKDMLTVFGSSQQFNAFIEQAKEFGIDVGPEATKASEGWQKANADLSLSFDFMKRSLLEATGGQESWNEAITNASQNIIFLTSLTSGFFGILTTNIDAAVSNIGALSDAFFRLLQGEKNFEVEIKKGAFSVDAMKEALNTAANKAIRFRELLEKASNPNSGSGGFRQIADDVDDVSEALEKLAGKFDFKSVITADTELSKVLGAQWEANASKVSLVNAEYDKQAASIHALVEQGADRERAAEALLQLEYDRNAALSDAQALEDDLADIDNGPGNERLRILQASAAAMQGFSNLATEVWATNQANNKELENSLKHLKKRTEHQSSGLESELEALEAQLASTSSTKERNELEEGIKRIKEDLAVIEEEGSDRADRLKKQEEERLEDSFKDVKRFQIASVWAASAVAAIQALAQLGPIAGPLFAAGEVATATASSLALIRSQSPSFHIGGNLFGAANVPSFTSGPDERTVTVTNNEIQSPADKRSSSSSTVLEVPVSIAGQALDTMIYELLTGGSRTAKLIRSGKDILRRPAFQGN